MRLDKLTDLEIGKKYIDIDKDTYTIAYIGKKRFFYYNQLGEECIGDEKDISRYELRPYEENKERIMKLENGTILEAGSRIIHKDYGTDYLLVTAVGLNSFIAKGGGNGFAEGFYPIDEDWIPYDEEKKEKWCEALSRKEINESYQLYYGVNVDSHLPLDNDYCIILREWNSKEEMIKDLKKV